MIEQFYEDNCLLTDEQIKDAWDSVPKVPILGRLSFSFHVEYKGSEAQCWVTDVMLCATYGTLFAYKGIRVFYEKVIQRASVISIQLDGAAIS